MIGQLAKESQLPGQDLAPRRSARPASAVALVIALALSACQRPHPAPPGPQDMSMGSPAAPVTVIEYASVACTHCATFNNEVFPAFKTKFIDTGRVRFILREALTGDTGLAAAGFLTARCAGKDNYFKVIDDIFHAQAQMYASGSPQTALLSIAKGVGLSESRFNACISDPQALAALDARWSRSVKTEGIEATPTFVINGETHEGEMTMAELEAAVGKAQERSKLP
jgi:protein-disulfide isomerase